MKQKKLGKKLALSKMTISNLNERDMQAIQAGQEPTIAIISDDDYTCYTNCPSCYSQCNTNCLTC